MSLCVEYIANIAVKGMVLCYLFLFINENEHKGFVIYFSFSIYIST